MVTQLIYAGNNGFSDTQSVQVTVSSMVVTLQNYSIPPSFYGSSMITVTASDSYGLTLAVSSIPVVIMEVAYSAPYAIPGIPISIDAVSNVSAYVPSMIIAIGNLPSQTLPVDVTVETSFTQLLRYTVPTSFAGQTILYSNPLDSNQVPYLQQPAFVPVLNVVVSTHPPVGVVGSALHIIASSNITVPCTSVLLSGSNGITLGYGLAVGSEITPTASELLSVPLDVQFNGSSFISILIYQGSIALNLPGYTLPLAGAVQISFTSPYAVVLDNLTILAQTSSGTSTVSLLTLTGTNGAVLSIVQTSIVSTSAIQIANTAIPSSF